jgi:MFS family permease
MSVPLVLFAVFVMTVANATVYATLGPLARGAGLAEVQVGTIFAASGLLFFLTSSAWGRIADRRRRRPVIVIGLAATAASLFLFAALFSLPPGSVDPAGLFIALLAGRLLYGLLAAGVQPAATAHATRAARARLAGAAWIGAAVGLGSIVGPASAACLVGVANSAPVWAGGVLAALAAVVALIGVTEPRPALATKSPPTGRPLRRLSLSLVLAFLFYFGFAALQPTTAFFVQDLFKIDTALAVRRASLVSTTFALSALVAQTVIVPRLALAPRRLSSIGITICLPGIASCLLLPDYQVLLVAFGVAGMGYGLAQPGLVVWTLLAADADRQGEAAGQVQAAMSAAWIAGPLAGTALYAVDLKGALLLTVGALVLSLLTLLALRVRAATLPPAPWAPGA